MAPELYGRYALLIAFIGLVSGFLIGPLAQGLNRFIHDAVQAGTIRPFIHRGLLVTSLFAAAGGLLAFPFAALYLRLSEWTLIGACVFVAVLAGNLRDRELGMFNTFRWRGRYVVLSSFESWLRMAAVACGVLAVGGLAGAAAGLAVASVVVAGAGLPWLRELSRQRPDPEARHPAFEMRSLYRFAAPLFIVNLLGWAVATSDRYVVAAMHGETVLGRYVAGYQVAAAAPSVVVTAFFPVFTPVLFEQMAKTPGAALRLDRPLLGICVVAALFGGAVVSDVDGVSRILLSNRTFDTGDRVIPLVSLGLALQALQQVVEHQAYLVRRTGPLVFVNLAAAAVSFAVNVSLADALGIVAPALAVCLTYATLLAGTVFLYRPSIGLDTWGRVAALLAFAAFLVVLARLLVRAEWPVHLRAPLRWAAYGLAFGAVAWTLAGRRLLMAAPPAAPR